MVRVSPAGRAAGWLVGQAPADATASLGAEDAEDADDAEGAAPLGAPFPRRKRAVTTATTTTRPTIPAIAGHGIPPGPSPPPLGARADPGTTGG
jgi:hypothetical protein